MHYTIGNKKSQRESDDFSEIPLVASISMADRLWSAGLQIFPEIDLPECGDVLLLDIPRREFYPFVLEFTHDLLPVIPEMNHTFHIPVTIVFQQRHHLPGSSSWSLSDELLSA